MQRPAPVPVGDTPVGTTAQRQADRVTPEPVTVRAWATAVCRISYVPASRAEVEEFLGGLMTQMADALRATPFDPDAGCRVGAAMVAAHFADAEVLGHSVAVLGTHLAGAAERMPADTEPAPARRTTDLLGAFATGYGRALHRRILDEQEHSRRALGMAQAAAEARFRTVFAGTPIGIGIADSSGQIIETNAALAGMFSATEQELRELHLSRFISPEDGAPVWAEYQDLLHGRREHLRREKRYVRRDGSTLHADMTLSRLRDGEHGPVYTVVMLQDISERHQLHARLRYQALYDPLTGLANRRLFFDRMAQVFDTPDPDRRVALCYLDLDGFKTVNDTLGHEVGDRLLMTVAERLEAVVSRRDRLVARIGGDEFVVFMSDSAGPHDAQEVARAALAALEAPVRIDEHELTIGASVGVVERPVDGGTVAELMKAADTTLYWAKSSGGRRFAIFDADRHAREVTRYTLSSSMPAALRRDEFLVEYQPLVRLSDRRVLGVEALVRWQHPTYGLLPPERFIEVAEQSGLIAPLGRWVLTQACRQAAAWQREPGGRGLLVSVNLAVRQIRDPGVVSDVARILDESGLDPGLLQLELTESAIMETGGEPLRVLRALAGLGLRLAIDDFGTGYSNFAYLCDLPVHSLKLAGRFVAGLAGQPCEPAKERIVASLVSLAHGLGMTATAEGVELAEQADRLAQLDCDSGQGWLFGHAVAPADITARLRGT